MQAGCPEGSAVSGARSAGVCSGVVCSGAGGAAAGVDAAVQARLEERVYVSLVSMSIGCMLVQRHAPLVFWNLAANAVFPKDDFSEVLHFRVHCTMCPATSLPATGFRIPSTSVFEADFCLMFCCFRVILRAVSAASTHTSATASGHVQSPCSHGPCTCMVICTGARAGASSAGVLR